MGMDKQMNRNHFNIIFNWCNMWKIALDDSFAIVRYFYVGIYKVEYYVSKTVLHETIEILLMVDQEELIVFTCTPNSSGYRYDGPWIKEIEEIFDGWEEDIQRDIDKKKKGHMDLVENARKMFSKSPKDFEREYENENKV